MPMIPYSLHDYGHHHPSRHLDQHFGLALTPGDLPSVPAGPMLYRHYHRTWGHISGAPKDFGSSIKHDSNKFQVNLDVQHFAPEEVSVKTVDGFIVVEGRHEERQDDHGYITRSFVRRYALPEGYLPGNVESRLSSDGVLTIIVLRKVPDGIKGETLIPIIRSGPLVREVKDQPYTEQE